MNLIVNPAEILQVLNSTITPLLSDNVTNSVTNNATNNVTNNVTTTTEIPMEQRVRGTILVQIAMGLHFYYLPVLVVVGLVGNGLTLAVMLQKKNRTISCCYYMVHLAVSDCLVLLYGAFTWFDAKWQLVPKTDLSCGICNLVLGLVSNYNIMVLMALALDRFLAIRFPLKSPVLCTVKRARFTLLWLGIVSAVLTFPVVLTATAPDGRTCAAHSSGSLLDKVHSVLSLVVFSVIPFMMLLFTNLAIVSVIFNRRRPLQERYSSEKSETKKEEPSNVKSSMTETDDSNTTVTKIGKKGESASARDVQLAVMLISVSVVFLLLILPLNVRYILGSVLDYKRDLTTFSIYYMILVVSAKTHITNSGVNFFLYCLSGSKFRSDVIRIVMCSTLREKQKLARKRLTAPVYVIEGGNNKASVMTLGGDTKLDTSVSNVSASSVSEVNVVP